MTLTAGGLTVEFRKARTSKARQGYRTRLANQPGRTNVEPNK